MKGNIPIWFPWADVNSFDLLAYERDNQHQDEAEEERGNGHEPREQGLHEADPESEADVSIFSSGQNIRKLTRQKGHLQVCLTPHSWLLICPLLHQHRRKVAHVITW